MRFILGLTGQTGAGKSYASKIAKERGFYVIDCDEVAHTVLERCDTKKKLVAAFGDSIIDGEKLNRKALAKKAFARQEKTELLNKIVLPIVVEEINLLIKNSENDNILLDAPTLFESGADSICDITIGVIADEQIRSRRIILRDNLTPEQAAARIKAGKTDEFYKEKCHYVIKNNGRDAEFVNNFSKLLNDILIGRQ